MAPRPFLDEASINQTVAEKCLDLYSVIRDLVYTASRPKLHLNDIVEDDTWRYEELPKALKFSESLSKAQLARLVMWKITHGIYRPFLPGMIQKNTDAEVQEHTAKAARLIKDIDRDQSVDLITSAVESALKQACNLKGVGPATGTLVLSVFRPDIVPFFEDELYYCLHPDHAGKLKYDKAEYRSLLKRALDVILNRHVEAWALEKTAYVLMHADKLAEDKRAQLKQCLGVPCTAVQTEEDNAEAGEKQSGSKEIGDESSHTSRDTKQAGLRRKADSQADAGDKPRRSKRRKAQA